MNPQGKGKIEWTDFTLSIVTGCKHACQYGPHKKCYADLIAQRIYKEKFVPTFRPERLKDKDLGKVKAGSKIFLSDMGDLFGDWVPDAWIEAHQWLVEKYPQYIFQFLTKNPKRYVEFSFPENCWLGTTWDGLPFTHSNIDILCDSVPNTNVTFVSFEPLLAPYPGELPVDAIDWIIIGELTGNPTHESHKYVKYWAEALIKQAQVLDIPVFVKNQLGATYPQREFPR